MHDNNLANTMKQMQFNAKCCYGTPLPSGRRRVDLLSTPRGLHQLSAIFILEHARSTDVHLAPSNSANGGIDPFSGTSILFQERSPLTVVGNNRLPCEPDLFAKNTWNGNDQSAKEQNGHDRKSKDPLECDDLEQELANAQGGGENTERKAHGVVLREISFDDVFESGIFTLNVTKKNNPYTKIPQIAILASMRPAWL
jgi:hypothetical protein